MIPYLYWQAVRSECVKAHQRQGDPGQRYAQAD
jgi:hypothetical protein